MAGRSFAAASIAAAPKIITGIASGNTSSGNNTPPRRAPSVNAAPAVPNKDNTAVANPSATIATHHASTGKFNIAPATGVATTRGTPVVTQCATAFANATAAGCTPDTNTWSSDPSSASAPNIRSNGNNAANNPDANNAPGANRPNTSGTGPTPNGNNAATNTKNITAAKLSAGCRNASRKSRKKRALMRGSKAGGAAP